MQQYSAHCAHETVELLSREMPVDFWFPNNPALDYQVWESMQERVYQTGIHNVDELK